MAHLFEPFKIREVVFRNRIAVLSTVANREYDAVHLFL